jgi:hypothetical protein
MAKDVRVSSETHKMLSQLKIDLGLKSIEQVILYLKKDSDYLAFLVSMGDKPRHEHPVTFTQSGVKNH